MISNARPALLLEETVFGDLISEIGPALFRGLLRQCFDYADILQQFRWQVVPLLQINWTVVGNPNFFLSIFPDQNL